MENENLLKGKKIKNVYYTVCYDDDQYRDGSAAIPPGEVSVENLVKYGERIIRDIANDDEYFNGMAFVGTDASIFEENEDGIIFDVNGNFHEVETGFSTSITVTYILGSEGERKMFDPKKIMNKFIIRDREAGNVITGFDTLEAAEAELEKFEEEDRKNKTYTEGFYEIAERTPNGDYERVF